MRPFGRGGGAKGNDCIWVMVGDNGTVIIVLRGSLTFASLHSILFLCPFLPPGSGSGPPWVGSLLGWGRGRLVRPLPCLGGAALGAPGLLPLLPVGPLLGGFACGGGSLPFPCLELMFRYHADRLSGWGHFGSRST